MYLFWEASSETTLVRNSTAVGRVRMVLRLTLRSGEIVVGLVEGQAVEGKQRQS